MKVVNAEDNPVSLVPQLDESTFRLLVDHYTAVLLNKAYKLLLDEESAKDIVQDIFVDLWEKRDSVVINRNIAGYLFGMLKHRFLKQVSRNNMHNRAMEHLANRMQEMEDSVAETIQTTEIHHTLGEVFKTLPQYMQRIFILRDKDYSIREIAEAMGLAEQTVKGYHSELKSRLKRGLLARHPELTDYLVIAIIAEVIKP